MGFSHECAELQVTTHFSFLRGASSADELFATVKALGIAALGVVEKPLVPTGARLVVAIVPRQGRASV